jgi:NTE family protein
MADETTGRTAFVLAGGGSLGAVQVGMLKALFERGIVPDCVAGASVGALNAAYIAGDPTREGVGQLERFWCGLLRKDVFPLNAWTGFLGLAARRDYAVSSHALSALIGRALAYTELEHAVIPCRIVATDAITGEEVVIDSGPVRDALLASAAIPGVFPPVLWRERVLIDGGVACNTPLSAALAAGVQRIIVLPTGLSCAVQSLPRGAIGRALHAVNLLTMRQLYRDSLLYATHAEIVVVPPLCPLGVTTFDFSQTPELIERAYRSTAQWLDQDGLQQRGAPHQLAPHRH